LVTLEHHEPSLLHSYFTSLGYSAEQRNGEAHFYNYSSCEEEYRILTQGVGCRLVPASLLELQGKDSLDFLHRITTNNVKSLPEKQYTKTIFTNEKGRILDRVFTVNFGDRQLLIGNTGTQKKLFLWLQRYIIMDDVRASEADKQLAVFEIIGPQARSFMTLLCGEQCSGLQKNEVRVLNIEDFSCSVLLNTFQNNAGNSEGNESFLVIAILPHALKLIQYVMQNKGVFDFGLIGEDAYEMFRIEKGIPAEKELNDLYNPHEAKLVDEVCFTKGCYIGQEVIARLATYEKVQKYLTGYLFNSSAATDKQFTLIDDDNTEIGTITSTVFSSSMKKNIGLGYLKKDFISENKVIKAVGKTSKTEVSVTVHSIPFKN